MRSLTHNLELKYEHILFWILNLQTMDIMQCINLYSLDTWIDEKHNVGNNFIKLENFYFPLLSRNNSISCLPINCMMCSFIFFYHLRPHYDKLRRATYLIIHRFVHSCLELRWKPHFNIIFLHFHDNKANVINKIALSFTITLAKEGQMKLKLILCQLIIIYQF